MSQGFGIDQFYNKNFKELEFEGDWKALLGNPELAGAWFIWGASGNGKTVFAAQLAKYLTKFSRVGYNSLEEGLSSSLRRAFQLANITAADKIVLYDKMPMEEMVERLSKRKSPNIIITDSIQYTALTKSSYKALLAQFPKKLFIFTSHAKGKLPAGSVADAVKFGANVKIWVEGYKATAQSRYGSESDYIIWDCIVLKKLYSFN